MTEDHFKALDRACMCTLHYKAESTALHTLRLQGRHLRIASAIRQWRAYLAGRARVRQYPRQMVAKMSMEMNTIWLKMIPYLQQQC